MKNVLFIVEDPMLELRRANEEQVKARTYRKTGTVPGFNKDGKRDPSPPVVAIPGNYSFKARGSQKYLFFICKSSKNNYLNMQLLKYYIYGIFRFR